jgi:outer membrane protein assembly factor BamB
VLAAACGRAPGPRGWAAPQPVETHDLTLVPYKKQLFALPAGSGAAAWQFPPKDKAGYRVSEGARNDLMTMADGLGLRGETRQNIEDRIGELSIEGPTIETLKGAVRATAADKALRNAFTSRVDAIVVGEKRALNGIRALYGDIALSGDGDTAFVPSYGGWLFALDTTTGATKWIADLDPMVGGATVAGNVVYAGTKSDKLYALDVASGAVASSRKLDGEIWAAPTQAAEGEDIYVPTLAGSLFRLNEELETVWQFEGAKGALAARPLAVGDLVYAGSWDNKLYAIDAATGEARWDIEADNWFWSEPVVSGGALYAASLDGKVYAVDAETGEARWPSPSNTGSEVRSGLTISEGSLIVGSRDGVVRKINLSDGTPKGELQIGTKIEADLVTAEDESVYAVPNRAVLYIINTSDMSSAFFDLPK